MREIDLLLNIVSSAFQAALVLLFGSVLWGAILLSFIALFFRFLEIFKKSTNEKGSKGTTSVSRLTRKIHLSDSAGILLISSPVWLPVAIVIMIGANERSQDGLHGTSVGSLIGIVAALATFIFLIDRDEKKLI